MSSEAAHDMEINVNTAACHHDFYVFNHIGMLSGIPVQVIRYACLWYAYVRSESIWNNEDFTHRHKRTFQPMEQAHSFEEPQETLPETGSPSLHLSQIKLWSGTTSGHELNCFRVLGVDGFKAADSSSIFRRC